MKRILLLFNLLVASSFLFAQECPDLLSPVNGATNVPVNATITWEDIPGVTGYIISLGTSPGATDIVNEQATGSSPFYNAPLGLPDNTQIFVTITLFFIDLPNIVCPSQSFTTEDVVTPPECTSLFSPEDSEIDVNVASIITWNYALGATGYRITIETAIGLGDIENNLDVGNVLSFNPNPDLPFDTEIFVTIVPYNENGQANSCITESFITGPAATLPSCATIISPADGAFDVPLTPFVEWTVVPNAVGYIVSIGRSPTENDVLDEGVFFTNSTFVINFEPNSVYFIRIVPFNDAGEAIGCGQTSFATLLGCGPYFDADTGELVVENPQLSLPETIGICLNDIPLILEAPDAADGYRWYAYNVNNQSFVISENSTIEIDEPGSYIYEAYNYIDADGEQFECATSMDFEVVASEAPQLVGVNLVELNPGLNITIEVSGIGDYEYALDDINGVYQDSNVFLNAPDGTTTVYVRDKNGCGTLTIDISIYRRKDGFPLFFTPNNDGFNDYWQFQPSSSDDFILEIINVYDRYGKLVKSIDPQSQGWDGSSRGERMNATTFWYQAITTDGREFKGYFALKL